MIPFRCGILHQHSLAFQCLKDTVRGRPLQASSARCVDKSDASSVFRGDNAKQLNGAMETLGSRRFRICGRKINRDGRRHKRSSYSIGERGRKTALQMRLP